MKSPSFLVLAAVVGLTLSGASDAPGQIYRTVDAFGDLTFTDPVVIASPPGESNQVFVVEQRGVISVITNLAAPTRTVFMDISGRVSTLTSASDERGCLGLAFHPGYSSNRYFFVFYTTSGALFNRLSRFQASGDFTQGLPASELILINQSDGQNNHNGGDLHFGPDGYLYVALGDEGGFNDNQNNSQRINADFFSAIMRLDVDKRPENLAPNTHAASSTNYSVPADNPYVGATTFNGQAVNPLNVRTEFWAVGLRNPWRMSFDPVTGWLYCGDVGQGAWEEINIITRGANYGWAFREGFQAGPKNAQAPAGFTSTQPIFVYGHGSGTNQGFSVTGGVVYRGDVIPQLYGHYVFADYVSDHIWAFLYDGNSVTEFRRLAVDADISAFGIDPSNQDILLADRGDDTIKRLVFQTPSALDATVVPAGAVWKYLDNGSNQGTAWRQLGFNDSSWPSGPAELGYGDTQVTTIQGGPSGNRYITYYFRHLFEVPDPNLYSNLEVHLQRDDGGVVYLNGQEVFRSNMPSGTINYLTLASGVVGGADEETFYSQPVNPSLLAPGQNLLAVEIHQVNASSSDVSFNLSLTGETRPTLTIALADDLAVIQWPAPAPGYALFSAEDPTGTWTAVDEPVVTENGIASVTVDLQGTSLYFQLAR